VDIEAFLQISKVKFYPPNQKLNPGRVAEDVRIAQGLEQSQLEVNIFSLNAYIWDPQSLHSAIKTNSRTGWQLFLLGPNGMALPLKSLLLKGFKVLQLTQSHA